MLSGFSSNRDADLARATNFANRALRLAPNDVEVLRNKAVVLRAQGDLDWGCGAFAQGDRACAAVGVGTSRSRPDPAVAGEIQGGSGELGEREAAHLDHGN